MAITGADFCGADGDGLMGHGVNCHTSGSLDRFLVGYAHYTRSGCPRIIPARAGMILRATGCVTAMLMVAMSRWSCL